MRAVLCSAVVPTSLALAGVAASRAGAAPWRTAAESQRAAHSTSGRSIVELGIDHASSRIFSNIDPAMQVPGVRTGYNVSAGFGVT